MSTPKIKTLSEAWAAEIADVTIMTLCLLLPDQFETCNFEILFYIVHSRFVFLLLTRHLSRGTLFNIFVANMTSEEVCILD